MACATQSDLETRYGTDALVELSDRAEPPAGTIDAAVVAEALADADATIDAYVGRRYALPLAAPVPARLVRLACDIAFFYLHRDRPTAEARTAYEDALAALRDLAAGRTELIGAAGLEPAADSADRPVVAAPARVFTATGLRGF